MAKYTNSLNMNAVQVTKVYDLIYNTIKNLIRAALVYIKSNAVVCIFVL